MISFGPFNAAAFNTERTPLIIYWERERKRLSMHVGVRLTHGKSAHNNNNMACTRLKEPPPTHTHTHIL